MPFCSHVKKEDLDHKSTLMHYSPVTHPDSDLHNKRSIGTNVKLIIAFAPPKLDAGINFIKIMELKSIE